VVFNVVHELNVVKLAWLEINVASS